MGEWISFTPVVRVETTKESGFLIKSTFNTTAGPCGVVRVQTIDTVELYGNECLTSSSFTHPTQYQSTDEKQLSPTCVDDKYFDKEIQTENEEIMDTSSTNEKDKQMTVTEETQTSDHSIKTPSKKKHVRFTCTALDEP